MKRVLIIAYFFPPISNMGSHRMLRFVRHLRKYGWEPIVLTGNLAGWSRIDESLLSRVPADLDLRRVSGIDLTNIWNNLVKRRTANNSKITATDLHSKGQRFTTFLNRWVMLPDKYFPWISSATKEGLRIIEGQKIDAIYSTSDPLSNHLVALRIARKSGLPWAAEFRDLWLGSPYFARAHPTSLHRMIHARMERDVVSRAAKIIALSKGIGKYFSNVYPKSEITVIYNCYENDDYKISPIGGDYFRILYAGALYSSRSPGPFFDGFNRFIVKNSLLPSQVEFTLVGGSPDFDLKAMVQQYQLTDYVKLIGSVSHKEALEHMQASSVLLAIQSPDDSVHVPGKLFEYIGAGRPILAISQPCEVSQIVLDEELGWVADSDADSVASGLDQIYRKFKNNGGNLTLKSENVKKFEVQQTTRQLAQLLNDLLN